METPSITTRCAALVQAIEKATATINEFIRSFRDYRSDLFKIHGELNELKLVLELLEEDASAATAIPESLETKVLAIITKCGRAVADIDALVNENTEVRRVEGPKWVWDSLEELVTLRGTLEADRGAFMLAADTIQLLLSSQQADQSWGAGYLPQPRYLPKDTDAAKPAVPSRDPEIKPNTEGTLEGSRAPLAEEVDGGDSEALNGDSNFLRSIDEDILSTGNDEPHGVPNAPMPALADTSPQSRPPSEILLSPALGTIPPQYLTSSQPPSNETSSTRARMSCISIQKVRNGIGSFCGFSGASGHYGFLSLDRETVRISKLGDSSSTAKIRNSSLIRKPVKAVKAQLIPQRDGGTLVIIGWETGHIECCKVHGGPLPLVRHHNKLQAKDFEYSSIVSWAACRVGNTDVLFLLSHSVGMTWASVRGHRRLWAVEAQSGKILGHMGDDGVSVGTDHEVRASPRGTCIQLIDWLGGWISIVLCHPGSGTEGTYQLKMTGLRKVKIIDEMTRDNWVLSVDDNMITILNDTTITRYHIQTLEIQHVELGPRGGVPLRTRLSSDGRLVTLWDSAGIAGLSRPLLPEIRDTTNGNKLAVIHSAGMTKGDAPAEFTGFDNAADVWQDLNFSLDSRHHIIMQDRHQAWVWSVDLEEAPLASKRKI